VKKGKAKPTVDEQKLDALRESESRKFQWTAAFNQGVQSGREEMLKEVFRALLDSVGAFEGG